MRFLILVKTGERSQPGEQPSRARIDAMAAFHQELARAGVLLDAAGLLPSAQGWRVRYDGNERTVTAGPFDDTGLLAGYTLIQVRSRDEAMEWARRIPNPAGDGVAEIEVRPLLESDELAPPVEAVDRSQRPGAAGR